MAVPVEATFPDRTLIALKPPEKAEPLIPEYILNRIIKNVPETELLYPEKEVTGIDRPVRKKPYLHSSCRTPQSVKMGIPPEVRKKTGTINSTCKILPQFCDKTAVEAPETDHPVLSTRTHLVREDEIIPTRLQRETPSTTSMGRFSL